MTTSCAVEVCYARGVLSRHERGGRCQGLRMQVYGGNALRCPPTQPPRARRTRSVLHERASRGALRGSDTMFLRWIPGKGTPSVIMRESR